MSSALKNNDSSLKNADNHHILPVALFPEFKDLKVHKFNLSRLSHKNHYIAHSLLHNSLNNYSMPSAWYAMNNKNFKSSEIQKELITPELYETLIIKRNKQCSENSKDKVMAKKLDTGEIIKVSKEIFDNDENLVGSTKGRITEHWIGTISVLDRDNNKIIRIKKEDFDNTKHNKSITKGKTSFKDKDGNILFLNVNDELVKNGTVVGINKGKTVSDETKNNIRNFRKLHPEAGNAKRIVIFDNKDIPKYFCHGTIKRCCKENNIPLGIIQTYKDVSILLNCKNKNFIGWYARQVELIKIK